MSVHLQCLHPESYTETNGNNIFYYVYACKQKKTVILHDMESDTYETPDKDDEQTVWNQQMSCHHHHPHCMQYWITDVDFGPTVSLACQYAHIDPYSTAARKVFVPADEVGWGYSVGHNLSVPPSIHLVWFLCILMRIHGRIGPTVPSLMPF